MSLFEQHSETLNLARAALRSRKYFSKYPENPQDYNAEALKQGTEAYENQLNKTFERLTQTGEFTIGKGEISPYTLDDLGISYPLFSVKTGIEKAKQAFSVWRNTDLETKTGLLIESLEQISKHFHELALATQHCNGQSYGFAFQFAGPNTADRALETIAIAYDEINHFAKKSTWKKPLGNNQISYKKDFLAIPKGIALVFGNLTNPSFNAIPALFANLMTGNVCLIKPHPKAIYPLAIFVAEIQKVLVNNGIDPHVVQLVVDSLEAPIGKELATHDAVKIIDYSGSQEFGEYLETIKGKTLFCNKSVVNSVLIDSAKDLRTVMRNLAFSACLYSGQLCNSPQNFFIPATGIPQADGSIVSYEEAVDLLQNEIAALALNPKMGPGILGCVAKTEIIKNARKAKELAGKVVLEAPRIQNKYYPRARFMGPTIIGLNANQKEIYFEEYFGPVFFIIKVNKIEEACQLAIEIAQQKGSLNAALYCTDQEKTSSVTSKLNEAFIPVSTNFLGFAFANETAAFSDFVGKLGSTEFINGRFKWLNNRMVD